MPSHALDHITIQGFKSIASIEKLELKPINVVIGANGSGKSNFVGAFAFLHAVREGRLSQYVTAAGGAEKLLHFGSKNTQEIVLTLSFTSPTVRYDLALRPSAGDSLYSSSETVYGKGGRLSSGPASPSPLDPAGVLGQQNSPDMLQSVSSYLATWRSYHLIDTSTSSPMRKTAKVDDNRFLRPDGSNLAAFLYYLGQKHPDAFNLIRQTVRQVAPFFGDFALEPRNLNPDDIRLEWRHKSSD